MLTSLGCVRQTSSHFSLNDNGPQQRFRFFAVFGATNALAGTRQDVVSTKSKDLLRSRKRVLVLAEFGGVAAAAFAIQLDQLVNRAKRRRIRRGREIRSNSEGIDRRAGRCHLQHL